MAYTFLGGMKATIWNDFFQMLVIAAGLIIIVIFGAIEAGGATAVYNSCKEGGRLNLNAFNPDPTIRTTFWTHLIGGAVLNINLGASSQTSIQKFLSVRSLADAKKSVHFSAIVGAGYLILVSLIGLNMYAYYVNCDPVLQGLAEKRDQMMPLYVMEILGHLPGLPGLFIASTFSAALSSVSGGLTAFSAVTLYDFIRPAYFHVKKRELSDRANVILSRGLTLVFGVVIIAMGFVAEYLGDLVLQISISIFGFAGGPVLAVISLGMFFPFINSWGALAGLLTSVGLCTWIAVGSTVERVRHPALSLTTSDCDVITNLTTTTTAEIGLLETITAFSTEDPPAGGSDILWIYRISYMYYSLIAVVIAIVVAIPVSLITGRAKNTDPRFTVVYRSGCCKAKSEKPSLSESSQTESSTRGTPIYTTKVPLEDSEETLSSKKSNSDSSSDLSDKKLPIESVWF